VHLSVSVFRVTAVAEACSWLGLLIGMFFKYVVVENEIGVKIFGPIHGALFVVYLGSLLWVAVYERWRLGRIAVGAAAAIPPFTSVLFERWVAARRRHGVTRARRP
jgi:integral membrane protein